MENESIPVDIQEVNEPNLYHITMITEEGMDFYVIASDEDFTGTINVDNYEHYPMDKMNKLTGILSNLGVHFDPGWPSSSLNIAQIKFEDIPHFFYNQQQEQENDRN